MRTRYFILMVWCFNSMACLTDDGKIKGPHIADKEKATADSANFTTIQWVDSVKQLGSVTEGQMVEVLFHFKNTGTKPLIIVSAKPSCGCTVPSTPEEPIMPGREGQIKAVFDSNNRSGAQHKKITVVANTKPTTNHSLEFNVDVISKKDGPAPPVTTNPNSF